MTSIIVAECLEDIINEVVIINEVETEIKRVLSFYKFYHEQPPESLKKQLLDIYKRTGFNCWFCDIANHIIYAWIAYYEATHNITTQTIYVDFEEFDRKEDDNE